MPHSLPKTVSGLAVFIVGLAVMAACTQAEQTPTATTGPIVTSPVSLSPSMDNTLYQDEVGSVSNGEGFDMIVGMTNNVSARRGVIAFDIAANISARSTIESVTLTINMNRINVKAGPHVVDLPTLTADWGEGASNALFQPGQGTPAAPTDATWRTASSIRKYGTRWEVTSQLWSAAVPRWMATGLTPGTPRLRW